jgi:hypothetical protein
MEYTLNCQICGTITKGTVSDGGAVKCPGCEFHKKQRELMENSGMFSVVEGITNRIKELENSRVAVGEMLEAIGKKLAGVDAILAASNAQNKKIDELNLAMGWMKPIVQGIVNDDSDLCDSDIELPDNDNATEVLGICVELSEISNWCDNESQRSKILDVTDRLAKLFGVRK